MVKYMKTAQMACLEKTNSGIIYLLPDIFLKAGTLVALIFLWRAALSSGVKADMSLPQMLSYAYASTILSSLLVVRTAASGWLSEGVLQKLYGRPISVLGQLAAQTVGGWLPMLLMFSLPMALLSPLLGVSLIPATWWFYPSLILCITLGFAMDFLLACLCIKLRGMTWLVSRIHLAIISLFSGTVIPIKLLPYGIAEIMAYQPFASLGGSPLSLLAGSANPLDVIGLQLFWNAVLWPVTLYIFKKSQEGIVSYGG